MKFIRARGGILGALAAGASIAAALGLAVPAQGAEGAQAALSGRNWTMVHLPARYADGITEGPGIAPVSCVPGTQFCVAITGDTKNIVNGGNIGQAALVTGNAGRTWTGHATLPSTFLVTALSCATAKVCWVTGTTWATGGPAVAVTTDGGRQWTDETPASWANVPWWANAIDCTSATTCWLAGTTGPAYNPAVAKTTDGGATWTVFSNLPAGSTASSLGSYTLNGISCVSATSCVAAGGLGLSTGTAAAISTTDGGATWSLSGSPALSSIESLYGVSCLTAAGSTTCYAGGTAAGATGAVALVSRDGGATWSQAESLGDNGWFSSVSCASAQNCWAAGAGTTDALAGTSDGGSAWSVVTSDTTNEEGSVSCPSVSTCVAVTDDGLWVTRDDGGLRAG